MSNNESSTSNDAHAMSAASAAMVYNSVPNNCSCCCSWSLETDSEGLVSSVRLVGWGGTNHPENYGLALHAICHFQKLQTLELLRYPLRTLPACLQYQSQSLTTLTIDGAEHIQELPLELRNLTSLKNLTIKDCTHLQAFPMQITQLPNLEQLSMQGCYDISSVPPEIGRLRHSLRRLTFRDFHIASLPNEICLLTKLEYLELGDFGAHFKVLPTNLGDCTALQTIYLELEYLTTLPTSIGKLPNLVEIITQGCCYLETIPKEIKHCKKLHALWLYDTDADTVVEFFNEPWDFEKYAAAPVFISLEKTELGPGYKDVLSGLPSSLTELNLGGNDIDDIQDIVDIGLPEGIRTLALQENPVIELEASRKQVSKLLRRYPQLGCIIHKGHREGENRATTGKILTEEIFHKLIMNQSGRILLENKRKNKIPLALWPIVLAKVPSLVDRQLQALRDEEEYPRDKHIASAIYAMLQDGPSLLNAAHERQMDTSPRCKSINRKRKVDGLMTARAESPLPALGIQTHKKQR